MSLTAAVLFGLCSCTVEKPDLEAVTEQVKSSEGTSSKESGKKKLTVKDSKIKGDLDKKFHVSGDIIDGGKTNMPTYILSKINLSADQFAEKLMSEKGYNRNDIDGHTVAFESGKEKLVVDLEGKHTNPLNPSPNITYSLDKGKEFESAIKNHRPDSDLDSAAAKSAVAQVTAMLDKLPIEYDDDFLVGMVDYTTLNTYYQFDLPGSNPDLPDDIREQIDVEAQTAMILQDHILLYIEGKDSNLDPDFKFTKDDNIFLVKGKMKINDMPVSGSFIEPYCITAAVSSRGVEYLYIENLYIADNGSSDSSIITAEQAVEAAFKDYEALPNKEDYEVYINDITLNYMRDNKNAANGLPDASKASLRPVWVLGMDITNHKDGYGTVSDAKVYADSGELMDSYFHDVALTEYSEAISESMKEN